MTLKKIPLCSSQMVARIVQELFRTAPVDILAEEIPNIMTIVRNLGEKDGEWNTPFKLIYSISDSITIHC